MRCEISRTSQWEHKEKPCSKAYEGIAKWTNAHGSQEQPQWYIDINSLEDLIEIANETGEDLVFGDSRWDDETSWSVEIYDGYRE